MSLTCNIEDKLKEYRCRKQEEIKLLCHKSIWERFLGKLKILNKNVIVACNVAENDVDYKQKSALVEEQELKSNFSQEKQTARKLSSRRKAQLNEAVVLKQVSHRTISLVNNQQQSAVKWFLLFFKIVLWIILFLLCLKLDCGAIYIIFSAFYLMFTNFRNGQRNPWEPSAYSVFNPRCEAIDGTLKPEQFEKEIRYGF